MVEKVVGCCVLFSRFSGLEEKHQLSSSQHFACSEAFCKCLRLRLRSLLWPDFWLALVFWEPIFLPMFWVWTFSSVKEWTPLIYAKHPSTRISWKTKTNRILSAGIAHFRRGNSGPQTSRLVRCNHTALVQCGLLGCTRNGLRHQGLSETARSRSVCDITNVSLLLVSRSSKKKKKKNFSWCATQDWAVNSWVIFYRLVPESARWLVVKGRQKEAEKVLRQIAAVNGKIYPSDLDLTPLFGVRKSHI